MLAIWLAVIVIAIAAEVATSLQLISIWAACGGLGALIAYLCGAELYIQIVVFFAVTFILLALTRPLVRKLTKNIKNTPTNADMNIGKKGKVTKIIDKDMCTFRVRVDNCDWTAVTENKELLPVGTEIVVMRIEGVKLIVEQVNQTVTA